MSFIPILSSSPPPFNATDSFEDDDEDDFGNFANFQDSLKDIKSEVLKKNCIRILDGHENVNHINGEITDVSKEINETNFSSVNDRHKDIDDSKGEIQEEEEEEVKSQQPIPCEIPLNSCDSSLESGKQTAAEQENDSCNAIDDLSCDNFLDSSKEKPNIDEEWADFASAVVDIDTKEDTSVDCIVDNPSENHVVHSIIETGNIEFVEIKQEDLSTLNESIAEESFCSDTIPDVTFTTIDKSPLKEASLNSDSDSADDCCIVSKSEDLVGFPKDFSHLPAELLSSVDGWSEGTAKSSVTSNLDVSLEFSLENATDDGFGDFQSTDEPIDKRISQDEAQCCDVEDFSDFQCANEWEDNDDFTDFKCVTESDWKNQDLAINVKDSLKSKLFQPTFEAKFDEEFGTFSNFSEKTDFTYDTNEKVEKVIDMSFPIQQIQKEQLLIESLDNWLQCSYQQNLRNNVWNHLIDVDKTPALHYHWSNSICNKKLLKALNIDSRNLLFGHNWNSSIPIFASNFNLNPLEPTKAPLKIDDRSDEKKETLTQETHQEIIPPAQFDWHSSGLVNPLDASNSSSLLDLDFFFTNDGTSTKPVESATWSLENELLGPDADILQATSKPDVKLSPLLEQILSCAKFSSSVGILNRKPQSAVDLSAEAQEVLEKIPNLNFMQAKVLMFPIRSSSP